MGKCVHLHSLTRKDAQMAKLVDALCSGRSAGNGVLVRIQFWALRKRQIGFMLVCLSCFITYIERE